ncbi:hypothetical protein TWF191_001902 [Orbilia oligospora]|uniref:Triacylglycerol lipase n=1 Tax=Orbilia oligospora TaxID=2813651 RepID=A0A7C8QB06_ORBOL|nr:hypothetical protein TWF191_001902 [Orbilia oligospora]
MIRPETPRNPIVLSHGLFGFDTLHLLPWSFIPPLQYWRGINEALQANNCKVIVTAGFKVLSLTTVSSPHQGSPFADYAIRFIGEQRLPRLYRILERAGLETGQIITIAAPFNN